MRRLVQLLYCTIFRCAVYCIRWLKSNVEDLYNNKAQRLEACSDPPISIENIATIEDPVLVELIKDYQDVFVEISELGWFKKFEVEFRLKPGAVVNRGKSYRLTWAEEE